MHKKHRIIFSLTFFLLNVNGTTQSMIAMEPFKFCVGVSEREFLALPEEEKITLLSQKLSDKQGSFYLHTVEPYVTKTDKDYGQFTFSVREGQGTQSAFVDVAALQADPHNNGALFQVASNFDCLEACLGKSATIDQLKNIHAQGEICSISALPGLLDRLYIQPPITLLEKFCKHYNVTYQGGSFPFLPTINNYFHHLSPTSLKENVQLIAVGVQKEVSVLYGQRTYGQSSFKAKPAEFNQQITQVFTAALDPYQNDYNTPAFANLASIFLHAAYKGTCDVMRKTGSSKVYLTLVGGGIFKNKLTWIIQALKAALDDLRRYPLDNNPEIILIIYNSSIYKTTPEWSDAQSVLEKLVEKNKGTWTKT